MASVTAEVMLYFGVSLTDGGGKEFAQSVDRIRFGMKGGEATSKEIIDILRPVWRSGLADGYNQCNDGG